MGFTDSELIVIMYSLEHLYDADLSQLPPEFVNTLEELIKRFEGLDSGY